MKNNDGEGKPRRRSPKPHIVHGRHPRFNQPQWNRGGSIYFESKYQKYSEMIRIDTVENAKESIKQIHNEFESAKRPSKMRRLISQAVLAGNRAMVASKNPRNSQRERTESAGVEKLYRAAHKKMSNKYRKRKKEKTG